MPCLAKLIIEQLAWLSFRRTVGKEKKKKKKRGTFEKSNGKFHIILVDFKIDTEKQNLRAVIRQILKKTNNISPPSNLCAKFSGLSIRDMILIPLTPLILIPSKY